MLRREDFNLSVPEGQYVHYTGVVLNVEGICTDIDSLEEFALMTVQGNDSKKWCVPLRNFQDTIMINGDCVKRYKALGAVEEDLPELELCE